MRASIGYLVIDTTDPQRLAPFWCALLDVQVDAKIGDGQFVILSRAKDGLTVGFQQVPDVSPARTGCTWTWSWTTSTQRPPRSKRSAVGGSNPAAPGNWKAFGGVSWLIQRATSSTLTSCRPI